MKIEKTDLDSFTEIGQFQESQENHQLGHSYLPAK